MALVAGALLALAMIASPRHGFVMRVLRRRALAQSIAEDDLLAALYRADERDRPSMRIDELRAALAGRAVDAAIRRATRHGLITRGRGRVALTTTGREVARDLIRKHRLWEHYLVDRAGLSADHVHPAAEVLEHVAVRPLEGPSTDPHGRHIPSSSTTTPTNPSS
jgi:manganese/zinc/iron transport system permease protein